MSKYLKGQPSEWLDGESVEGEIGQKVLGAYDRAAFREPGRDTAHQMLERIKRIRDELTELEALASTIGSPDIGETIDRAKRTLFTAECNLKGRFPEASQARPKGKPSNLGIRKALERAIGLGKSWKFAAALLFEGGRLTGDWSLVYDQIRKVSQRMTRSDDNPPLR